jgi:hypothetical protein
MDAHARHVVDATYVICMYMYGTTPCTGEEGFGDGCTAYVSAV